MIPAKVRALLGTRSIVVVESPFGAPDEWVIQANVTYARAAARWCLLNGLVPLASHLLYTQMLNDNRPDERELGIEAGLTVNRHAVATLVFCDRGLSRGMVQGIRRSLSEGRPVYSLRLPGWSSPSADDLRSAIARRSGTLNTGRAAQ